MRRARTSEGSPSQPSDEQAAGAVAAGPQRSAQDLGARAGGHQQVGAGLVGVGEPHDVGQQVVPRQVLQRREPGGPRPEGPALVDAGLRLGAHPQRHLGDDPERALGAQRQAEQVGAGGRGRRVADLQHPGRRGQGQPGHELVEAADAGRVLAGRARGRVPADGGELPALRQVPEGQALAVERLLQRRSAHARPDGDQRRRHVERLHGGHAGEVDGHRRPVVGVDPGQPADDAGAPAEGDDDDAELAAGGEQRGGLVGGARQDDGVRGVGGVALAPAQQVQVALPAGPAQARVAVGADVLLARAARRSACAPPRAAGTAPAGSRRRRPAGWAAASSPARGSGT